MHLQLPSALPRAPGASARAAARAPVRAALRRSTLAVHDRMHGLEPFRAIAECRLSLDGYLPLIQSLLLFHSAIGAAAARSGWARLSSAPGRLALLEADLAALGGAAPSRLVDWQPCSPEEALGALYAAEGSMLGGRVIAAQLDYLFGSAQAGRRFFIGSPNDSAHWRELLSALEERCTTAPDLDRAIAGALLAFQLFEDCVVGQLVGGEAIAAIAGPIRCV